jgi:hypothetical protein
MWKQPNFNVMQQLLQIPNTVINAVLLLSQQVWIVLDQALYAATNGRVTDNEFREMRKKFHDLIQEIVLTFALRK